MTLDLDRVDLLAVLEPYTRLKRVATTQGGEWAGPCPFCGGRDRFRVWPNHPAGKGRWWCRGCGRKGDAVDFLQEAEGLSFRNALERLGVSPEGVRTRGGETKALTGRKTQTQFPHEKREPVDPAPSPPDWPAEVEYFLTGARIRLEAREEARAFLAGRGLTLETARAAGLGWTLGEPLPLADGLAKIPEGLVIPWAEGDTLWAVRFRAKEPGQGPKYTSLRGSVGRVLYLPRPLTGRPVVLVEGELDALLILQEAGDLCDPVATGSAMGGRAWKERLEGVPVLVAFDADEAGEKAAGWWRKALPHAVRWRPVAGKDPGEMRGLVREWVKAGLRAIGRYGGP